MCGISGSVGVRSSDALESMVLALKHRGPDRSGFFQDGTVSLGMSRLSIIDIDAGSQPIFNETGDACIVYNGELYNFRELRASLIADGYAFRTASDTEVVLHLYERYGRECVTHMRGMFAFAIRTKERLFLARDRLGIKPLHYFYDSLRQVFIFASEIKALLTNPAVSADLDEQAFVDRVLLGHTVGERTVFREIKTVLPGHTMEITWGSGTLELTSRKYYSVKLAPAESSYEHCEQRLDSLLEGAVDCHMLADVDVALSLSGGLDSTVLGLYLKDRHSSNLSTFTIADADHMPDVLQARVIAKHLGSDHHEIRPTAKAYLSHIAVAIAAEEQPASLFAMPLLLMCREIRDAGFKVCLNGEGSDELFGGYPEYLDSGRKIAFLQSALIGIRKSGLRASPEAVDVARSLTSADTYERYLAALFQVNLTDQLTRHHLDVLDRYSMAFSVEMRVPFLDNEVVENVNTMRIAWRCNRKLGIGKYILKKLALRRFGPIAADAVMRRKLGMPSAGFAFLEQFERLCNSELPDSYVAKHPFRALNQRFVPGGQSLVSKRDLLLFDLFEFIFVTNRGALPNGFDLYEFIRMRSSKGSGSEKAAAPFTTDESLAADQPPEAGQNDYGVSFRASVSA